MPPTRKLAARRWQPVESPATECERVRAELIMRNNRVFQSLGISTTKDILNKTTPTNKAALLNKTIAAKKAMARENSGSLYDPGDSDGSEEGAVDKVSQNVPCNTNITNGGAKGSKRVRAPDEQDQNQPPRVTRQRTKELVRSEEGVDAATTTTQEDALSLANFLNQTVHDTELRKEGQSNRTVDRWNKGKSMGRDLDRISRGLNTRIPVLIAEGKKRPEAPMQAAKLALEGGIIMRQHIPIFTRWKEYKDIKNKDILPGYMGKISAEMESILAAPVEGQVSKSPAEVVAQVLPKSKFLQNIGLHLAAPKRSSKANNEARVIELEAEVAAGKQDKKNLRIRCSL